jgi:drug/metabolite transporter (DMT)-like permease
VVVAGRGEGPPGATFAGWAVAGGVITAVALAAFYRGLAIGAMTIVAPVSATGAVIPVIVGLATGERPSWLQIAGIAIALGGVMLASREEVDEALGDRQIAAGLGLALFTAACLGGFTLVVREASADDAFWSTLVIRSTSAAVALCAALALRVELGTARPHLRALAAIGALEMVATLALAEATGRGLVSVIAVLGALYPVATVILARTVLRERAAPLQQVGVLAALVGVALLAGG